MHDGVGSLPDRVRDRSRPRRGCARRSAALVEGRGADAGRRRRGRLGFVRSGSFPLETRGEDLEALRLASLRCCRTGAAPLRRMSDFLMIAQIIAVGVRDCVRSKRRDRRSFRRGPARGRSRAIPARPRLTPRGFFLFFGRLEHPVEFVVGESGRGAQSPVLRDGRMV